MTRLERKNFFFEKKKQKTFVRFLTEGISTSRAKTNESFLRTGVGLPPFFQKSAPCFNLPGRE